MRILITGINGFIGRHLARQLLKRNHSLWGLTRKREDSLPWRNPRGRIWYADINNQAEMAQVKCDLDAVIHLAGPTAHDDIAGNPELMYRSHHVGLVNVIDLYHRCGAKRFVFASSGKIYGKTELLPFREDAKLRPDSTVGSAKMMAESLLSIALPQKERAIARIFNVWGPGSSKQFLIPTIIEQLKAQDASSTNLLSLGNLGLARDYVHVDTVVRVLEYLTAVPKLPTDALNVCSGVPLCAALIASLVASVMGRTVNVQSTPGKARNEAQCEYGSTALLKDLRLFEQPQIEDGLRDLLKLEGLLPNA